MNSHRFQKGNKLGQGRPKDSISKRSLRFADALMESGVDPVKELIGALNNAKEGYFSASDLMTKMGFNAQIITTAEKMLPYMYPKLNSIEFKRENPLDNMSPQEKIEAMKEGIKMLQMQIAEEDGT